MKIFQIFIAAALSFAFTSSLSVSDTAAAETESFEYLYAQDECPSPEMLNYSTQYWHQWLLQSMAENERFRHFCPRSPRTWILDH